MAAKLPDINAAYSVKFATMACTSAMLHCGLSAPISTGRNVNPGSDIDRSERYSRHMSAMIKLSLGTTIPPKARAEMRKGGRSQNTCMPAINFWAHLKGLEQLRSHRRSSPRRKPFKVLRSRPSRGKGMVPFVKGGRVGAMPTVMRSR